LLLPVQGLAPKDMSYHRPSNKWRRCIKNACLRNQGSFRSESSATRRTNRWSWPGGMSGAS